MGKLHILSGCLVILTVVHSFPNRRMDTGNSKLASVLSDYWSQRGFHDAADPLLASESQGKDLMLSGDGDDIPEVKKKSKILIPQGRMTPPGVASKHTGVMSKLAGKFRQQRKRLLSHRYPRIRLMNNFTPAMRRQDDMEILESVTLMDGGTPQKDGTIRSERKYTQGPVYEQEQMSPLSYRLKNDDLAVAYKQYQQQYHQAMESQHTPSFSASYHYSPGRDTTEGKLSLGQIKPQPFNKYTPPQQTSLNNYQKHLYAQQQQQQGQNVPAKPTVVPIFVLPPPHKPLPTEPAAALYSPPASSPQASASGMSQLSPGPTPGFSHAHSPALSPAPSPVVSTISPPSPTPDPTPAQLSPQVFEQQFQHPFNSQSSLPSTLSSLAQLTSAILAGASSVAAATSAATSAAASALAKETAPASAASSPPFSFASAFQSAVESELFPKYALPNSPNPHVAQQQASSQPQFSPLVSGLLSAASIPSASQTYLPPPLTPFSAVSTSRPGVISDYEQLAPNQLAGEEENLVTRISRLVETGKKILYFPKGVVDTVDVVLKQMERSPAVAYWGDKFFSKVFGDTSGTK